LTFELGAVESAVLSGLRKELQHPDLIAEYVRTYHQRAKPCKKLCRERLPGMRQWRLQSDRGRYTVSAAPGSTDLHVKIERRYERALAALKAGSKNAPTIMIVGRTRDAAST
jgi:hypothetical protein